MAQVLFVLNLFHQTMRSISCKIFFFILFSIIGYFASSQNDIIHTVKGEKIVCSITKEDSTKVYFKIGGNLSSIETSIARDQISSIQYAPKKTPEIPKLMQAPGQAQTDDYVAPTSTAVPNSTINAASAPKKVNHISLCVGMSAPVGKFNKEILDTNEIGPGLNGQMVALGFTHLVKNNLGFHMNAFYSNNELNSKPITEKYKYNTDSNWMAEKAYWRSFGMSFGLLYYKEINDFTVFAKINAGYISLKYPELKLINHADNYLKYQAVTSDAVSFGGGLGASYKLNENLNVNFEVNYLQATCKYSEILILGEEPGIVASKKLSITKRDIKQTYQNVFASLGMSYWF